MDLIVTLTGKVSNTHSFHYVSLCFPKCSKPSIGSIQNDFRWYAIGVCSKSYSFKSIYISEKNMADDLTISLLKIRSNQSLNFEKKVSC